MHYLHFLGFWIHDLDRIVTPRPPFILVYVNPDAPTVPVHVASANFLPLRPTPHNHTDLNPLSLTQLSCNPWLSPSKKTIKSAPQGQGESKQISEELRKTKTNKRG